MHNSAPAGEESQTQTKKSWGVRCHHVITSPPGTRRRDNIDHRDQAQEILSIPVEALLSAHVPKNMGRYRKTWSKKLWAGAPLCHFACDGSSHGKEARKPSFHFCLYHEHHGAVVPNLVPLATMVLARAFVVLLSKAPWAYPALCRGSILNDHHKLLPTSKCCCRHPSAGSLSP